MFGDEKDTPDEDWTPEKDQNQEKRMDRLLDMVEKQLKGMMAERPAAPAADPVARVGLHSLMPTAQIQFRMIENGFVMSYWRADPVPQNALGLELYNPSPVEVYVSGHEEGAAQLAKAMQDALKLSRSAKAYRERLEGGHDPFPPAVGSGEGAPIPDF